MRGFWDWIGRVIMLALAGMITLSIIGAIAAIPSGSLPQQIRFERPARPVPEAVEEPMPPSMAPPQAAEREPGAPERSRAAAEPVGIAPVSQEPRDAAEWLEAITYALLALVGLAALAVLLLWRALIQWRRSAEALEALASRPR